jgi:hypothetical protein
VIAYFNGSTIQAVSPQLHLKVSIPTGETTETFTPTVSFSAGKTVQVNQRVTSSGRTITLDRVVIAPSETRFYCLASPDMIAPLHWTVLVARKTYASNIMSEKASRGNEEGYGSIWSGEGGADLQNQTGVWTVKASGPGGLNTMGSWQFTFTVA